MLCEKNGKIVNNIHGGYDEETLYQEMASYYACIMHINHKVGRLSAELENGQTFHNFVSISTSYHGEHIGIGV